jgi:hypothetical protein
MSDPTSIVRLSPGDRAAEESKSNSGQSTLEAEPSQYKSSDSLHSVIPGTTSLLISAKSKGKTAVTHSRLRFPCPIFQNEIERNLPHNCDGTGGNTMNEFRLHLTQGSRDHPPHLSFLERCATCSDDIIEDAIFYKKHGPDCCNPQPMKPQDTADEQYKSLCMLVLKASSDDTAAQPSKCPQKLRPTKLILIQATFSRPARVQSVSDCRRNLSCHLY